MINKQFAIVLVFILATISTYAQTDSCWTALLVGKDKQPVLREHMVSFNKDGFYMYRNCVYDIRTKSGAQYSGKLVDIKPDTLYFTNYSQTVAKYAGFEFDTIPVYYKELNKLRLINDRSLGLYTEHSFDKFDFIFKKDTTHCGLTVYQEKIYSNDSTVYELTPYLTDQGIDLLYKNNGHTYYYQGSGMLKPNRAKRDTTYTVRNYIWYTPNAVEKINGIALGLFAENIKNDFYEEKDSLKINGLNIEVNPFGFLALMEPQFTRPYPDSIEYYNNNLKKDVSTKINGVSISAFFIANEAKVHGANFSGGITLLDEIHGLSISGISNFAYKFNGVSIAGLHNRATVAKGLQVSLFNKTTKLRGLQIGLWNKNGDVPYLL